jgi:WGR domain
MRLVKQTVLFFKEGNSDKTYEIDLCDTGSGTYTVNFRYGKRGTQLKEGSKTPVPVSLAEANRIFDAVETEKIGKGYTTDPGGVPSLPGSAPFVLDQGSVGFSTAWMNLPASRNKAILQRLYNAVNGQTGQLRSQWKLSRVIWKAGEYKIQEAIPFIVRLFNSGDAMQEYACCWALARIEGPNSIPALRSIYTTHLSARLSAIAGAGLLQRQDTLEKEAHLLHYTNSLPEDFKQAVISQQPAVLEQLAMERIAQLQPNYKWLETLYLLSTQKKWLRPLIRRLLLSITIQPGYFKHIRSIFKLAELLDDFEILGLLSCRIEREPELFSHYLSAEERQSIKLYLPQVEGAVKIGVELAKTNSRLAYSNKTRWHFHRRTLRRLQLLGKTDNTDYVKLATALLIAYQRNTDEKAFYSEFSYRWRNSQYENLETRFPASAQAIYLHQVLNGNSQQLKKVSGNRWQIVNPAELGPVKKKTAAGKQEPGGLLKMLGGLFGKKKKEIPAPAVAVPPPQENTSDTPFLHLWNQLPQAYIQLLMDAQMDEIHEFAQHYVKNHPAYNSIIEKLDSNACKKLLGAAYTIPAAFGYEVVEKKYNGSEKDSGLLISMFNSIHAPAREKAKQWTNTDLSFYLDDANFITALIFAVFKDIRDWSRAILPAGALQPTMQKAVAGKAIAFLVSYTSDHPTPAAAIADGADTLTLLCGNELAHLPPAVVADLLQHPVPEVLLFGLRILGLQKTTDCSALPDAFISGLLQHAYQPVRAEGIVLLKAMPMNSLLNRTDLVKNACLSAFADVRQGIAPLVGTMAAADKAFGNATAAALMPVLLRKEKTEGIHETVSQLLCNELSNHLQAANKETALNLLYSNYAAAQLVGIMMLEKYTSPAELTIPQVIALGGHEHLAVREWSWKFYTDQVPRIKYEKEAAVKLLDSKWEDTRVFARDFFLSSFEEKDWNTDLLITLADSSNPGTEAFARELITRYFQSDSGPVYLQKLSQHPREKMQLFVTNYLERYAAGNPEKIKELEFYFRSVLTRVNRGRVAKNRIFLFLENEGKKSALAAQYVSNILSGLSATAAIEDRARCIQVLLQLKALYHIETPLVVLPAMEKA